MRILIVHHTMCIRTIKIIYALKSRGHDVFVAYGLPNPNWNKWKKELLDVIPSDHLFYFSDRKSLRELLSRIREMDFDVVQCANEPNWPTSITIETGIAPVVYDCHDMTTMRIPGLVDEDEKIAFEKSQGIIFTGGRVYDYASTKYNIHAWWRIFYSYLSKAFVQPRKEKINDGSCHVVYEGGITPRPDPIFQYRYYLPIFQQIANQGIHVHIYPSRPTAIKEMEENPFLHLHSPLPYEKLLYELSQYHYGFVGFNFDIPEDRKMFLNATTPNKVFDYLSAGLPSIVHNMKASSEIVEKYKIGFTCEDIKDLCVQIWAEEFVNFGEQLITPEKINFLAMENQIGELEDLYRRVI